MSSSENPKHTASGRAPKIPRKESKGPSPARASGSAGGRNDKVAEILSLIEDLSVRDLPRLAMGLKSNGALGGLLAEPHTTLFYEKPKMEPSTTPAVPAPIPAGDPKGAPVRGKGKAKADVESSTGATRRTMKRKARKAYRDALKGGNPEVIKSALERLEFLAEKYGEPLEEILPEDYVQSSQGDPEEEVNEEISRDGDIEMPTASVRSPKRPHP